MEEGFGHITGDAKTQTEGLTKQAAGAVQDLYGQAKDIGSDAAQVVRHGAAEAEDYLRGIVEQRPYTTAFAALCVGWVIGRLGRH